MAKFQGQPPTLKTNRTPDYVFMENHAPGWDHEEQVSHVVILKCTNHGMCLPNMCTIDQKFNARL